MRDGAETRRRLERAALKLFVAKGVAATTVREVAAAADIAEGTLYRHYVSKEELAWELFHRHYRGLALELDRLQAGVATLPDKLEIMIRHFCKFFDQDPLLFSYLLLSQHGHLQRVTSETPNPVDVVVRVMEEGLARNEVQGLTPEVAAALVMGLVLQVAVFRIYGRLTEELSPLADTLVKAAWRLVAPGPAGTAGSSPGTSIFSAKT
ncbi:MAG: TetR/AcrR family transcriptional regulator [Deltaproteobacteria bacterium]|nr:TetR/AcrR family transcriptional regulator [Deltaproteobacteria bacterium]